MPSQTSIESLRSGLQGTLLNPADPLYDRTRRVFNAMIDRRPALIVRCERASDVVAGVNFAREHDLPVCVRGGGHGVAGKAVCDGGLMIDLSSMKQVRVDPSQQTAKAEAGLTLGEFDRATQGFGLATTLGIVSVTGIAGLTLGGGLGWLGGKYGLACDNAISFDVVTADGKLLTASAAENEDLYWALRGGGGNFGVVTSIEFRVHEVGSLLAGPVFHALDSAKEALRFFIEYSTTAPDELSTVAALATLPDGVPVVALAACYCGSLEDGERVIAPLRSFGRPIADQIRPLPYLAVQSMLDGFFPAGREHYWKSNLTRRVSHEVIEHMVEFMMRKPSPFTIAALQQLHGVAGRVPTEETAFAHRGDRFDCAILSQWANPAEADRNISWTREFHTALQPHVDAAVYVNNLVDEPDGVVRAAFGANFGRLVGLKRKYDPTNFFRFNQNIRPDSDAAPIAASDSR
jgi:FAD/FMN-containing dehydrogenase